MELMESNPITLIIQAHGSEDLNVGLIANRVQLLSVSGAPNESGIMSFCKDKNGKVSSLDTNVMKMLKNAYSKRGSIFQHFMFNDILINKDDPPGILEQEYENCGIIFDKNGGFKPTQPFSERRFYFRPNPHEDCERCIYGEGSAKCERCIPIRDPDKKMSSEYGLTIICTDIPDDNPNTLAGMRNRIDANLHKTPSTRTYWRNKIPRTSTQSITNFDNMFDTTEINLSELLTIFREMGYVDIYIIDPTCRDCHSSNPSRGRLNWHSAFEQVVYQNNRIKREAFKSLETTLDIITYNRNTQNNRNSRTNQGSIQNSNLLTVQQSTRNSTTYLYQVSSGIAITLAAFIAFFAYMSRQQSGGRKTHKKKRIFSTSIKKGNNPKYTRYNRTSSH
jgi:hypothetical protein